MTLKFIWTSDPHFTAEGLVQNHDPRARLQAAIDHINTLHSDAALTIISGDMVNRGTGADYAAIRKHLDQLKTPYFPMMGNHDNRELLRNTLPLPADCMADFIQYQITTEDALLFCLDTNKSGADAGEFCAARQDWLRERLRAAGDTPSILFLHHPPFDLGLPMQDTERMVNGDEFLDLIADFDCVKYLCIGHVHRPISGSVRGIPFSTMRAILYQAPSPQPEWTWQTFKPADEAPNLGIVTVSNGDIRIHFDQFTSL